MGINNPEAVSDLIWTREAIARLRFQAEMISREDLLTLQQQLLAERKAISQRALKGYAYAGQYETEEGATAAVLAGYLIDAGRPQDSLAVVTAELPVLQRLVANDNPDSHEFPGYDFRNYTVRQVLSELLARQAEALAKLGKPTEAAQAVRQAIEIIEPFTQPEPCYLYDLAHHLTLASTLPESAGVPDAADRAVKALEQFIAWGFDNPYKLQHDERLKPLQDRADFQKLVRDLEAELAKEAEK